jgi:branched-chain amino acid aminotransferase
METCYVNGHWVPATEAAVHLFDSGLMFGETITETLRTFNGVPFELDRHIDRLERSLYLAHLDAQPRPQLASLIRECAERGTASFGEEVLIKVDVTRGIFGYYRDPSLEYADSHLFLHALPVPFWRFDHQYDSGLAVAYPVTRQMPSQTLDPRIKHRSRLFQSIAEREAAQVDEHAVALLMDLDGFIAEGTGWNIFAVKDGSVATPTLDNCLDGISRAVTIELCRELGLIVSETRLLPSDVQLADELFATATSYCLLPITRVHGRAVADGRRGPVTTHLIRAWSDRVGLDIVAQARTSARREEVHAGA